MSWDFHRRGYHHGNLREALMQAAIDLIADKGPSGFTFAEAARSAGVSPAAPYRHFRDRDALVAEVATRGFVKFALELERAWAEGRPEPQAAFIRLGRAISHLRAPSLLITPQCLKALCRALLIPDPTTPDGEPLKCCEPQSEAICVRIPKDRRPPELMMSLHIWSMAHGVASLFARGDQGRQQIPMSAEDLLEAEVHLYLRGIGLD